MISPGLSSCEHSLNTLRYADRVKELAANDPSGDNQESPDDDKEESELAALRSLNVSICLLRSKKKVLYFLLKNR